MVASQTYVAEVMVTSRAASIRLDMVAFVPVIVYNPSTTAWTPLALIQKPLGRIINRLALVLSACQTLVPLDLAVDAEALTTLGNVVATHRLPV